LRCAASELRRQLAKGRVDTTSTDRWFVLRISLIRPTFKPGKYGQAFPSPPTAEKLDRPRHQQAGWEEGGPGPR
jgi:hypothetical protein